MRALTTTNSPAMSRHERRSIDWTLVGFATFTVVFIVAFLWHFADEVNLDLIVYVPPGKRTESATRWVGDLRTSGLHVHVVKERDMADRRSRLHIPPEFAAEVCAVSANPTRYVLSGYVPPIAISRMLREKPQFQGLILLDPSGQSNDAPGSSQGDRAVWGFWSDGHRELFMRQGGALLK